MINHWQDWDAHREWEEKERKQELFWCERECEKELDMVETNEGEKMETLIGKPCVVRANVAGVHAGLVESIDGVNVVLKDAYRLWRVYTRDKSGSISDVAANGLKPDADHSIGARLDRVMIVNPPGLEIVQMTDAAYKSLADYVSK